MKLKGLLKKYIHKKDILLIHICIITENEGWINLKFRIWITRHENFHLQIWYIYPWQIHRGPTERRTLVNWEKTVDGWWMVLWMGKIVASGVVKVHTLFKKPKHLLRFEPSFLIPDFFMGFLISRLRFQGRFHRTAFMYGQLHWKNGYHVRYVTVNTLISIKFGFFSICCVLLRKHVQIQLKSETIPPSLLIVWFIIGPTGISHKESMCFISYISIFNILCTELKRRAHAEPCPACYHPLNSVNKQFEVHPVNGIIKIERDTIPLNHCQIDEIFPKRERHYGRLSGIYPRF